jgi:hypothetical protein
MSTPEHTSFPHSERHRDGRFLAGFTWGVLTVAVPLMALIVPLISAQVSAPEMHQLQQNSQRVRNPLPPIKNTGSRQETPGENSTDGA